ncbi:MAG: peptidoglycan-N-acetylglucosamine deacetylase [Candidatus Methanomethylophilaceae archaeon]|nr:peptidoglycan-N-acetylglucosamine deacetylase [Candidatus Methanomethylophilaceae archaeon]
MSKTASLTIDVEDWYHIPSVCGSAFSEFRDVEEFFERWDGRYDYLTDVTKRVLQILEQYGITATFFVVADVIEHYPGLVESIVDQGHEIACHGLHHSCVIDSRTKEPLISPEIFKGITMKAKRNLEMIYGKKIIGYRAPNAFIAGWMIDILEDLGFKYDSSVSVNSLYNKSDSALKGVSSVPYYPKRNGLEPTDYRDFIEFPWPYYDIGLKIPTGGGPMLRFLGAHMVYQGLRQSLNRGHTLLYFHPIDISNEPFPDIGKRRPFFWMVKGEVIEKRIRYILDKTPDVEWITLGTYCTEMGEDKK